MSFYEEIIKTGILFRRPFRMLSNLFYIFKSGEKTCKPFMLKLESSAVCNLKCKMCPLNNGLSRDKGVLSFDNFKKVFDDVKPAYLNLTGIGEPLFNKDIFKIISYARKKGSVVKLDTNATLLNEENTKKMINAEPNFVSVSIDGITKKSYESIRIGANFEKVVDNLKNLVSYRNKARNKTKIHLFFVLQKDNVLDLPKFIEFADKIGVDSVNGTIVIPMGKNKNKENLKIKEKDIEEVKEKIKELKKKVKVKLNIEGIMDFLGKKSLDYSKKPCFWPWYQPFITWDGYVAPCCIFCDNEIVLGNAFKEPLIKIINSRKAKEFRKQLVKKRTGICKDCGVDESFIYNKLKVLYKLPLINRISSRK